MPDKIKKCSSCGKDYDFEFHGNCPGCGSDEITTLSKPNSPKPTKTEHSHQYNAGEYLIKFQRQVYIGFGLTILGCGLTIIGSPDELMYLGVGITFVGSIIMLVSVIHIGNAGEELMK